MKNNLGLRIAGIILLFMVLIFAIYIGGGDQGIGAFIDVPSLLFVTLIPFGMLLLAGLIPDYFRGIGIGAGKSEYTLKEYKSSAIALGLAIKMFYLSGVIGTVVGVMQILRYLDDISNLGPAASVCLITVFYAMILNAIHYAVKARIDQEIVYRDNQ